MFTGKSPICITIWSPICTSFVCDSGAQESKLQPGEASRIPIYDTMPHAAVATGNSTLFELEI
jgi:hypothetical protein